MTVGHIGTTQLSILLTVSAGIFYGASALYGAWIDGGPRDIRDEVSGSVMDDAGAVHAREEEKANGSIRD